RFGLREDLVGLDDLLEAGLRIRRLGDVRVKLTRLAPEGALDLAVTGGPPDLEDLVQISFGRRHRRPSVLRASNGSLLPVDVLEEGRQLVGGAPHRADRLFVVHAEGPHEAERAERLAQRAIGGADERQTVDVREVELLADPNERAHRLDRADEKIDQRGALLE